MEKYKCKLCCKNFINGRALGGHMRSHMLNLYGAKIGRPNHEIDRYNEFDSVSASSSSSASEEEEIEENGEFFYRPEHSAAAIDGGSVVLQNGDSETESLKNPARRRSERIRGNQHRNHQWVGESDVKRIKSGESADWVEPEAASSISDTSPEDVALCLMMLSRDQWDIEENEDEEEEEYDGFKSGIRKNYRCETCKKSFRSYQALGGHRASHKKIKPRKISLVSARDSSMAGETEELGGPTMAAAAAVVEEKIHQCPVCFRVFPSGQALGGHKRTHGIASSTNTPPPPPPTATTVNHRHLHLHRHFHSRNASEEPRKIGEKFIDLNLPAPMEDDQMENSAVFDADFAQPSGIKCVKQLNF